VRELPSGNVTCLADVEGSGPRLWENRPDAMPARWPHRSDRRGPCCRPRWCAPVEQGEGGSFVAPFRPRQRRISVRCQLPLLRWRRSGCASAAHRRTVQLRDEGKYVGRPSIALRDCATWPTAVRRGSVQPNRWSRTTPGRCMVTDLGVHALRDRRAPNVS